MSELKYSKTRQTAQLADLGLPEIEKRLEALVAHFGEAWLGAEGTEPLQKLWSRRDGLATNQLVLIGDAVLSLRPKHTMWVDKQIAEIKSGDQNSRRGAMFELLGLNMLGASTSPTTLNFPGYDAIVSFPDGAKLLEPVSKLAIGP